MKSFREFDDSTLGWKLKVDGSVLDVEVALIRPSTENSQCLFEDSKAPNGRLETTGSYETCGRPSNGPNICPASGKRGDKNYRPKAYRFDDIGIQPAIFDSPVTCMEFGYFGNLGRDGFSIGSLPELKFIEIFAFSGTDTLTFKGDFKKLEIIGYGAFKDLDDSSEIELKNMRSLKVIQEEAFFFAEIAQKPAKITVSGPLPQLGVIETNAFLINNWKELTEGLQRPYVLNFNQGLPEIRIIGVSALAYTDLKLGKCYPKLLLQTGYISKDTPYDVIDLKANEDSECPATNLGGGSSGGGGSSSSGGGSNAGTVAGILAGFAALGICVFIARNRKKNRQRDSKFMKVSQADEDFAGNVFRN